MKTRSRLGVAGTLTGVSAALLVGCAGGSPSPASNSDGEISGTVTGIWDASVKASMEPVVEAFEKEYPDVTVDINYQGGDIAGLVNTQLQAGTAPDILISFPGGAPGTGASLNVITMASQGRLLDLSDSAWTADLPEQWASEVSYEGKTYAYPGIAQGMGAIYNTTTLDELGLEVPTTLSEVYELCAAAQDAGIYAYAQALGDALGGPQMLSYAQTGTLVYGPDPEANAKTAAGELDFAKSGWKDQFEIYKKMFDEGCFGEGALGRSGTQGTEEVAGGKALAVVTVSAALSGIAALSPDDEYLVTPMPATDNAEDTYATALLGYTLAVNAKGKNPEGAKAFLEFLSQPEQIATHAEAFAALPAIPQEGYEPPAALAEFAPYIADGNFTRLPSWTNPEVQPTLNETLQSLFLGTDTVDSALQKMQEVNDKGMG